MIFSPLEVVEQASTLLLEKLDGLDKKFEDEKKVLARLEVGQKLVLENTIGGG